VKALRVPIWFAPLGLRALVPVDLTPGPAAAEAAGAAAAAASGDAGLAASSAPQATAIIDISIKTDPNDSHIDFLITATCSLMCEHAILRSEPPHCYFSRLSTVGCPSGPRGLQLPISPLLEK
jgi:hypothetical protein